MVAAPVRAEALTAWRCGVTDLGPWKRNPGVCFGRGLQRCAFPIHAGRSSGHRDGRQRRLGRLAVPSCVPASQSAKNCPEIRAFPPCWNGFCESGSRGKDQMVTIHFQTQHCAQSHASGRRAGDRNTAGRTLWALSPGGAWGCRPPPGTASEKRF